MCVIIASPKQQSRPSLETLELCAKSNPHGSGLAWVQHGLVHYIKGLRPDAIAENLHFIKGPVVVHFRIATVGGKAAELCHPFPIANRPACKTYGRARSVLFHNGTWTDWAKFVDHFGLKLGRGPVSDTRAAAAAASMFGFQWLKNIPNRFCMLSKRGIRILGDWQPYEGCHFSNLYWVPRGRAVDDQDFFSTAI